MKKIFSMLAAVLFSATMFASTYIVAGSPEVMGSDWSKDDAKNQMELVEGVYTLVKENVTLGANTYYFKVIKDGDWDALNKDNRPLVIGADGVYTITFTLKEEPLEITVTPTKTGDAVVEKHYLVAGEEAVVNGAAWSNNNADNLMVSEDQGATYKLRLENLTLSAKDYEYKIVEKGTWNAYFDGGNGKNAKFNIPETGVYTIEYVFTVATSICEVSATKSGDAEVTVGYYLVGNQRGWAAKEENLFSENPKVEGEFMLVTTLVKDETIKVAKAENGNITTWYPDGEGESKEFKVTDDFVGEKVVYFRPAGFDDWKEFIEGGFFFVADRDATAIVNTTVDANAVKMYENGKLIIIKNGVRYDALGQIVK